jgi:hypothetical protein
MWLSFLNSDNGKMLREGGGAVQRWLELSTSYIHEGGGVVRRQLELSILWCEGGGAVWLEGEVNLP